MDRSELPLVSVITPAYNRASYLDETIRSILSQDYKNIEYIVLDDGSTDNTRDVLTKYEGRIAWETHPNMGETRTVNKGFTMVHGEIFVVVNSDDPLLPGAVSTAVEFMETHPEVLVAYPDWNFIGPKSETTRHIQVREYDYVFVVSHHHCTPGPGAFIRRKALDVTGPRDPRFKYVADLEYWLRLGLYGPFARIPKTLATFRVHPGSASVSSLGTVMSEEHIRLMELYFSRDDLPPQIRRLRREAFGWAHFYAALTSGVAKGKAFGHYARAVWLWPPTSIRIMAVLVVGLGGAFLSAVPAPMRNRIVTAYQRGRAFASRKARSLVRILPSPLRRLTGWGYRLCRTAIGD